MPISRASLPATPAKIVLTPNEKHALTGVQQKGDGNYYLDAFAWDNHIVSKLTRLRLVTDLGPGPYLTEDGLRMRDYLAHQTHLGHLAKQVRAEGITGEDLADLAAGIDAGEETGTITGTTVDFQLAFALAASLADQSAEDLRAELEDYMGWGPRG